MVERKLKNISHAYPAILWDGHKKLPGLINLLEDEISFEFEDFKNSNLTLEIPYQDIEHIKMILIFNISRNGLLIKSKQERRHVFVIEEIKELYDLLLNRVN